MRTITAKSSANSSVSVSVATIVAKVIPCVAMHIKGYIERQRNSRGALKYDALNLKAALGRTPEKMLMRAYNIVILGGSPEEVINALGINFTRDIKKTPECLPVKKERKTRVRK